MVIGSKGFSCVFGDFITVLAVSYQSKSVYQVDGLLCFKIKWKRDMA